MQLYNNDLKALICLNELFTQIMYKQGNLNSLFFQKTGKR